MSWRALARVGLALAFVSAPTFVSTPVLAQDMEDEPVGDDAAEVGDDAGEAAGTEVAPEAEEAPVEPAASAETSPPPPMVDAEPQQPPPDPVADAAAPLDESRSMEPPPDAEQGVGELGTDDFDEPNLCTGPFCQGSIGLTLLIGNASVGDLNYLILGGGVSYYVINGLALGLDGDVWFLEDPTIYTVTPQAKYVLHFIPVLKPYVGAFYRHYFLSGGFDDLDSIGGRAGAYLVTGGGSYLGLGAIYEKFLGCGGSDFRDCDGWYPEISIGFSL